MSEHMSDYLISVIVPVYNAEAYIEECLRSILGQTLQGIEIIVVNDGSKDKTLQIVRSLAEENPNIVIIDQENKGVACARAAGLKKASADYIGWVDADDFISAQMYEKLYRAMVENHADHVYCDYDFYPEKVKTKEKWFKNYYGVIDWKFLERNTQSWNSLTSKELLDSISITELFPRFDEYAWIAVLLNAEKIVVLNESLYHYRVGIDSQSGGSYYGKVQKFKNGVWNSRDLYAIVPKRLRTKEMKRYFEYRLIYALILLCVVSAYNSDETSYLEGRKELLQLKYLKNPLTKEILDHNHGKVKSFVLRYIIPSSYLAARTITRRVFS